MFSVFSANMGKRWCYCFLVLVILGGYFYLKQLSGDISHVFQETGGCGNMMVYKINEDNTMGISVSMDVEKLSTTEKTFQIESAEGLKVGILLAESVNNFYCNDVLSAYASERKILSGKTGVAVISISEMKDPENEWNRNYTATIRLKDVSFLDADGEVSEMMIKELLFQDVSVGWLPG